VLEEMTQRIVEFRDARDWRQFHSPKNLAASIVIESAELLELMQWSSDATLAEDVEARRGDIERELSDIMIYCLLMGHDLGIDVEAAITAKMLENERKYPLSKAGGSSRKYDKL
jgi:NTP pyrophosphatase (non-canonical NTP hydrolase)